MFLIHQSPDSGRTSLLISFPLSIFILLSLPGDAINCIEHHYTLDLLRLIILGEVSTSRLIVGAFLVIEVILATADTHVIFVGVEFARAFCIEEIKNVVSWVTLVVNHLALLFVID